MDGTDSLHGGRIRIRTGSPADLETILQQRRRMFTDMGYRDEALLNRVESASRPFFAERLGDGRYRAWLAETPDGTCVAGGGVMVADHVPSPRDPLPRRPLILSMYTEPSYRRMGIARRLMEIMLLWCRAEGFGSVTLYASDQGRSLYEALGFGQTNELRLML